MEGSEEEINLKTDENLEEILSAQNKVLHDEKAPINENNKFDCILEKINSESKNNLIDKEDANDDNNQQLMSIYQTNTQRVEPVSLSYQNTEPQGPNQ